MSTVADHYAEINGQQEKTQRTLSAIIIFATAFFNLALCFINTTLFGIGAGVVIGAEITLLGLALGLALDARS